MAIMKMKRLRLMLVRSRKEEVLRELAKLGCVEFSELEGELQESGLSDQVKRESSALMALKTKQASLEHAVELLNQYAPVKGKLLEAKPELANETLLDASGIDTDGFVRPIQKPKGKPIRNSKGQFVKNKKSK